MIAARLGLFATLVAPACTVDIPDVQGPPADAGDTGGSSGTGDEPPPISTAPPGPTDSTDASADDDGSSTGLGGLETGDDVFTEVGWGGGGKVVPGTSLTQGFGEAFVLQYEDNAETVLCVVAWETTMTEVLTSCADCDFAFTIENGPAEVEVDENGACAEYGIDVGTIEGQLVHVGYRMNVVLQEIDGTWTGVGDAEFDAMTGDFYYEWAEEA